jgi:hypothetical protein
MALLRTAYKAAQEESKKRAMAVGLAAGLLLADVLCLGIGQGLTLCLLFLGNLGFDFLDNARIVDQRAHLNRKLRF